MITSLENDKVKHVRALQSRRRVRQREGQIVLEGVRLVEETIRAGQVPLFVLYTEAARADERVQRLLQALHTRGAPCYPVSESVMAACSATETPQGILAVVKLPALAPPQHPTLTLIVDGVRDPGNLGTILRTALAADVEQVLLTPGTVDPSNAKAVRAAMGAHLHLPLFTYPWERIAPAVATCEVWLADVAGAVPYTAVDWTPPVAIIVGGEASGATPKARALAKGSIYIPMNPRVESLNTAIATAIILFEVVRQRRRAASDAAGAPTPRVPR